ncbi:MAG: NAAT family transporter [Alphaproteobacteria bacterium]|nr:MAG: NAAT family transporter [Alphaproteobacteria bacterium]
MTETLIAAFMTFLVVLDPAGIVPIFAGLSAAFPAVERRRAAIRGVAIASGILIVFALVGETLLELLGIGLPAFRIAGGVLLLLLSIDMVMARQSGLRATTPGEHEESTHRTDISVFPLAIPLIAGPGAMTSVVLLMGRAHGLYQQAAVLGVLIGVLVLTLICLLLTGPAMRLLGVTGANVISRVSGIILAALAVQFVIDGVRTVWPAS